VSEATAPISPLARIEEGWMKRREFIKGAVVAGLGVATAKYLPEQRPRAPTRVLHGTGGTISIKKYGRLIPVEFATLSPPIKLGFGDG
jgi:hypothetical protein